MGIATRTYRIPGFNRAGVGTMAGVGQQVTLVGVPEAIAKLNTVKQVAYRELGLLTYRLAQGIEILAKGFVPYREGHLRAGIQKIKLGRYDWTVTASSIDGGADREYAAYVEYGWSGHPEPEFYMQRAREIMNQRLGVMLVSMARRIEAL